MKPSQRIAARLPDLRQQLMTAVLEVAAKVSGYPFTPADRAEFEASDDGKKTAKEIEVAALTGAILADLDEEHDRRAKFEAEVLERLGKLEALAKPLRFVVAPEHASQAELAKLAEAMKDLGATMLPHGVKVLGPTVEVLEPPFAGWYDRGGVLEKEPTIERLEQRGSEATKGWVPIPCPLRMPPAEHRVMFFVPSEPHNRWRVGHWDNTARAPRWWDEATESGDEPIVHKPEAVTHWMLLPGEPT